MSPFNVVHYLSIVVILGPGLLLVLAAGELETGRRKAALLKLALVPVALLLVVGMFAVIWPGRATTASAADSRALYTAIAEGRLDDVKRLATGPHSVSTRQADIPPPLMYALVKQQERIANYLVAAGADVNAGVDGITPLHLAITSRYIDLVKVMIVKGASINARAAGERGGGGSPFLLAVSLGTYNEDEILTLFPPSGPGRMWLSSMPTGALPWSGTVETTRGLLRRNARSDVTDQNGLTPLMQALLFFKQSPTTDYLETARVLIDGAANVNAKSRGGHTL